VLITLLLFVLLPVSPFLQNMRRHFGTPLLDAVAPAVLTTLPADNTAVNVEPAASSSNPVIYVGNGGNDSNDGLSRRTAKLTLGAANTACPSSCEIMVDHGGLRVSTSVKFTKSILLKCDPRATIIYTSNSNQIVLNGQGSAVFGCGFVGQGSGVAGLPPIVSTGSFFVFSHNSVSLFGPTGGLGELSVTAGQNDLVLGNIFNQNGDADLELLNGTASQVMFSYIFLGNILSDLIISNTGTGASLASIKVNGNDFSAGEAGKANPCFKISSMGTNIADLAVSGNTCVLSQAGPPIGYSIANSTNVAFNANIYDASGFNGTVSGLQLSSVNFVSASGNTIWNSGVGTGIAINGTAVNVQIGTNSIGSAVTGISIEESAAGTTISPQKFTFVTTNYADSGNGTDIQNRSYAGTVTLTAGTGTFTIPSGAAFTSTSKFACSSNDTTTITNGSKAIPATNTTATVSGTGSDVISVTCTGH
jgi:hypothetical protein